jgi:hypothetical protein
VTPRRSKKYWLRRLALCRAHIWDDVLTDAWNEWQCDKVRWVDDTAADPLTHHLAAIHLHNRYQRLLQRHRRIIQQAIDAGVPREDLAAVLQGDAEEIGTRRRLARLRGISSRRRVDQGWFERREFVEQPRL